MLKEPKNITKKAIANTFGNASTHYDEYAFLQYEIAKRLLERLSFIKINPQTILDLGAGTGTITKQIAEMYPLAKIIGVDLAFEMTRLASSKNTTSPNFTNRTKNNNDTKISYVCNDMEHLALRSNSIDFIFSNCTIQWSMNLPVLFAEVYRVLKPNGLFLFTTFGPNTLIELKKAWAMLDNYEHVNYFEDMHNIGDALLQTKFAMPVIDQEEITIVYPNLIKLFKDLKGIGANTIISPNTIAANSNNLLFSKNKLAQLEQEYRKIRQLENDKIGATFEVLYGIAWKENISLQQCNTKIKID